MHETKVKEKYNQLFGAEQRFKGRKLYPIHKKLDFKGQPYEDIYHWINDKVDFPEGSVVLDAGCGVGYGSLLIAEQNQASVLGISLSEKEVERANENAVASGMESLVLFRVSSYDTPLDQQFDRIIAVESIKHSRDLSHSLENLKAALKSGGQLIILEDLYQQIELNADAQQLLKDYKLVDLFRLSDYNKVLETEHCEVVDLSDYVLPKVSWKIESKMLFAKTMHKLTGSKETDIFSILRGGYHLDRLYHNKDMQYAAIIYTKP